MSDQHQDQTGRRSFLPWIIGLSLAVVIVLGILWGLRRAPVPTAPISSPASSAPPVRLPVQDRPVIDYEAMAGDDALKDMMDRRKAEYGIDETLDLIVKGEETIRIGGQTVSMAEIQRQIALKEGRIIEVEAGSSRDSKPEDVYGIHVVQPGENLWNIHFALLKAYFGNKGISLPPLADEPRQNGTSTGIGRLLKFSEGMVFIYNLGERRLETEIESIIPSRKIVIYKMSQVFALLDQIRDTEIDRIRFDGDTLWLPAER